MCLPESETGKWRDAIAGRAPLVACGHDLDAQLANALSIHFCPSSDQTASTKEAARDEMAALLCDGARRARTADLLGAIQALSQLSYSPAALRLAKPGPERGC